MPSTRDLDPVFRPWAEDLLQLAKEQDSSFIITSTRRSLSEQSRLYKRYQDGESKYPVAPPGTSKHELGLAVDIARPDVDPLEDDLLQALGEAWEEAGGIWGGRYSNSDPIHFQYAPALGPYEEDEATPAPGMSDASTRSVAGGLFVPGGETTLEQAAELVKRYGPTVAPYLLALL